MLNKIKMFLKSDGFKKLVKFCLTGVLNTVIDMGVYTLLLKVFHVNAAVSQVAGYSMGVLNSYIINRSWTFSTSTKFFSATMIKFILANLATLLLSLEVLHILTVNLGMGELLAKLPVTAVTILVNFFLSNFFVFRK